MTHQRSEPIDAAGYRGLRFTRGTPANVIGVVARLRDLQQKLRYSTVAAGLVTKGVQRVFPCDIDQARTAGPISGFSLLHEEPCLHQKAEMLTNGIVVESE